MARLTALVLCFTMLLPLWHPGGNTAHAGNPALQVEDSFPPSSLKRRGAQHNLPASLTEAPSVAQRTAVNRSGPRTPGNGSTSDFWIALSPAPVLPSLRIDPVAWDIDTPTHLLPSEHGLVPFAIPPPLYVM